MKKSEPTYSEGSNLEALVALVGALLGTALIAAVVILTNNGNTPPSW